MKINEIEAEFEIEVSSVQIEPHGKYSYNIKFQAKPKDVLDMLSANNLKVYLEKQGHKVTFK